MIISILCSYASSAIAPGAIEHAGGAHLPKNDELDLNLAADVNVDGVVRAAPLAA